MSDNITLPRDEVELALEALDYGGFLKKQHAITALRARLAAPCPEPESKTPAWWMDGLTATLMREGVNKHRAREIAKGYWEAYCQIPGQEEVPR